MVVLNASCVDKCLVVFQEISGGTADGDDEGVGTGWLLSLTLDVADLVDFRGFFTETLHVSGSAGGLQPLPRLTHRDHPEPVPPDCSEGGDDWDHLHQTSSERAWGYRKA